MRTVLLWLWLAAMAGVFAWPYANGSPTLGDDLTRRPVWVALAYYAAAMWLMVGGPRGRLARWCWTLAWAAFVIHVAVAFHFYHHWSHAAAVEHVRERSGVGEGVFVSYLFTLLWTADVAWWCIRPIGYAHRPRWIDGTLHGFMLAMWFAATVVYETGPIRWAGIALFGTLVIRWISTR